jgi:two-component system chemotaxis sensor kinase CheA
MNMSQYRELFLSETREHINNLNKLVVELELSPGVRETIDALFREAHSIKGMAATMGYERTAQLSHHLEGLLDGFRRSGEVPLPVVDYLLAGIDLLDGLLDDLQSGRPEQAIESFIQQHPHETPVPVIEVVDDLMSPLTETNGVDGDTEPTSDTASDHGVEQGSTDLVTREESDVFQVRVDLVEDTPASAARCVLILGELEKSGELISSTPDLTTLRGGEPCMHIQVWLRSLMAKEQIEESLCRISGVAKVRFIKDRRSDERRAGEEAARTVRVRTDLLDRFVNLAGELITQRYMLNSATTARDWDDLGNALIQTSRLIDDLHHHVLQARLMPLEIISGRLPRIVRDLSRKTGKKIALQQQGVDVGIDRVILEALADPLVHLVRNAIDHGIENEGTVTVSACRERDIVLIEVADDGKGMDPELLRRKAVEMGILTLAQADTISDRDALMLVCQPGFSTAGEVTETSGRGVGMDVVKAAAGNLGGTLEIISEPGQGTRFQMRLPHSIAIIKVLLVACAGLTLAIPMTRIQRTLDLPTGDMLYKGRNRGFMLDDEVVNLYSLAAALGQPQAAPGETTWVVLIEVNGRSIGLEVDRLIGHRDAFVKSLGFPMDLQSGLSGATIEGNGQIVFIINPQSLLESSDSYNLALPGGWDAFS